MYLSIYPQITPTHIIHEHDHDIGLPIISLSFQPVQTSIDRTLVSFTNLYTIVDPLQVSAYAILYDMGHIVWSYNIAYIV